MAIGNFGALITFSTSDTKILTFKEFKREASGRWSQISRISKKPKQQFLGPDLEKVTFTIELSANHGVKPRDTIEKIINHVNEGTPETLVIGSEKVGKNKYVITKASATWDEVWNKGELVRAKVDITLEEYV